MEKKYGSFNTKKTDHISQPMFFGEPVNIARYDKIKYKSFNKLVDKQLSFFWRPEEVTLSKDKIDWKKLNVAEQHIFVSNLKRQSVLDSIQSRGPNLALLPFVSIPELETWIENWGQNETIHSKSYTYILQNLFNEPDKIFDSILETKEIVKCSKQLTKYYDDLIEYGNVYKLFGEGVIEIKNDKGQTKKYNITMRELKKKLALCVASINVLEGVRFYVSFACSWAFAERELMEGNAKIIKLICRDENVHLASTQQIINNFIKNPSEGMQEIWEEIKPEILEMYKEAVKDEKEWAEYLFKHDSMIGLNKKILDKFIEWIANIRLKAIGLEDIFETKENVLPWVSSWLSNGDVKNNVQVAPQETEISSYLSGNVLQDVEDDSFMDINLFERN